MIFDEEYKKIKMESQKQNHLVLGMKEREVVEANKNIIIFGYGILGTQYAEYLKKIGISERVSSVVDNNRYGEVAEGIGIEIEKPNEVTYGESYVFLATLFTSIQKEMKSQLLELGVKEKNIYTTNEAGDFPFMMSCSVEEFEREHLQGYRETFEMLKDTVSRQILLDRVKSILYSYKIQGKDVAFQYFDPEIISFDEGEVFVDAGCLDGATAIEFARVVSNTQTAIYSFEPDQRNYEWSVENLKDLLNTCVINKALYREETVLYFDAKNNGASHITGFVKDEEVIKVEATTVDAFFKEKVPPTFIKMDIEGAELDALIGSELTIKNHSPKLAICVYHKIEDIYTIPRLIKSFGDYEFYLGHYSEIQLETVLYAIPKEK